MPVKAAGHQQDFNYMRKARFSAMSSQLGGVSRGESPRCDCAAQGVRLCAVLL